MNRIEKVIVRLIVQFTCTFIIGSALLATRSYAEIASTEDLQPDQLIGPWEALEDREGMAGPCIYQMFFVSSQEAWLARAVASNSDFADIQFFGRLVSAHLAKGQIKLEFALLQGQSKSEYTSIRIEGKATRTGSLKLIEGKIILSQENGKVSTEQVAFGNALWTRWIPNASVAAEKAINEARQRSQAK
jgi:hypothetical protein